MIVTFWKGVFVADTLDERGALGKAGFDLHEPTVCHLQAKTCKACRARIGRRYWSDKIEAATRLKEFCNERALAVMKEHLARIAKSRAVDANIAIPAPEGLEYMGFQKAGIAYALQRKDTLIADEMGLGKSIQALGFVNALKPKNVLVICPSTLIFNWRNEAMKWLVGDYEVFPVNSKRDVVPNRDGMFVIVNYEKLTGTSALAESLTRVWDVLVVDEVHMIKNINAERTKAVIGENGLMRRAHRCLFLSGTPIENYPKEIWPVAAVMCPAKFGDWWEFARRYCGLHQEERNGRVVWVTEGSSNLAELQQRLRSTFMVRRLKRDVLTELPPKRRQLIALEDSKVDWSKHPQFKRWKEIYEKQYDERMAKLEAAKTESEYKEAALSLEKFTGIAFDEMSEFRHTTAMAKLPLCIKYIEDMLASGVENLVVFAHHVDVIEKLLEHFEDDAVAVYGKTSREEREKNVKLFQDLKKRVFIGQIRTAGVGITLTAANTVVFVEIDWVPGVLSQCEDRLCRIGQKKMVHVIHLILGNTLDANMVQKVVAKQIVIDKALDNTTDLQVKKRKTA